MKRRQLQAERLALYLAKPDVAKRLQEGMGHLPGAAHAQARQELAGILSRAQAGAGRIELAGPHPDEPPADRYRLLLEELREDMRQRSQMDDRHTSARGLCEDVAIWISEKLASEPTVGDAARALLGEDATLEVVSEARPATNPLDIAPPTLDEAGELPEGTPHHQDLAYSILGCHCMGCVQLRAERSAWQGTAVLCTCDPARELGKDGHAADCAMAVQA